MGIFKVFGATEPVLKRFVRKFVSSTHDVDDICQETVTRALEVERCRKIDQPGAFLFGIARNVIRERLDKQSRSLVDFIDDFSTLDYASEEPPIEQMLDSRRQLQLFMQAVANVPPQCQRVFIMKKVYGYSHKEIADRLDISISTVEKHVAAGLKRCLDELDRLAETNRTAPVDAAIIKLSG